MKRLKSLSLKKKRTLAVAGMSVLTLAIVGTIAYNADQMFFRNLFHLGDDVVEFVETFKSPDHWQPCQEVDKTAIATNKNATPRYVRMKINEYWRTKNTQTPESDHETTDLPLTWTDGGVEKHFAVINTQNDDKWELKNDGWYYYKTTLAQNESTLSLLKSVTFNCEVNTVGEIRYSVDGLSGESVPTEYAEANYHLYITFQMSDEEMVAARETLYDVIAKQTIGLDNNVDFGRNATKTNNNGNGVNTLASHANDDYPVYYFRGNVDNNVVVFNDICWRIMRTAEGGSVKILYAGNYSGGKCPDGSTTEIESGVVAQYASDSNNLSTAGYMRSPKDYPMHSSNIAIVSSRYASNDVSWDGSNYTLVNPVTINGSSSDPDERALQYRYSCHDSGYTTCEEVHFMMDYQGGISYSLALTGGDKVEDMLASFDDNTVDSPVKAAVDTWYEENITENRDKIADVIYCNDRQIDYGSLANGGTGEVTRRIFFAGWTRITGYNMGEYNNGWTPAPSIDCARKGDRFTVNNGNGNKALKYPIALPTADEYVFASSGYSSGTMYGLYDDRQSVRFNDEREYYGPWTSTRAISWTMTPLFTDTGDLQMAEHNTNSINVIYSYAWHGPNIRPVVALIHDTYIQSGEGSLDNPYILEW